MYLYPLLVSLSPGQATDSQFFNVTMLIWANSSSSCNYKPNPDMRTMFNVQYSVHALKATQGRPT